MGIVPFRIIILNCISIRFIFSIQTILPVTDRLNITQTVFCCIPDYLQIVFLCCTRLL